LLPFCFFEDVVGEDANAPSTPARPHNRRTKPPARRDVSDGPSLPAEPAAVYTQERQTIEEFTLRDAITPPPLPDIFAMLPQR